MTPTLGPTLAAVVCLGLAATPRAQQPAAEPHKELDVTACRRALRHAELLELLTGKVADGEQAHDLDRARADLALVRLEAELLQRVAPLEQLASQPAIAVIGRLATLDKSGNEELVLARLAFCVGDIGGAEFVCFAWRTLLLSSIVNPAVLVQLLRSIPRTPELIFIALAERLLHSHQ